MLTADSVAINRLQIKGDKRTSQALIRDLEQTSWTKPLPAHLQHAWIFVRELNVKGKARDLRLQTAHHLDSELQHAVRAIHGDAGQANVIWFATLPELIAFLLVDLALGKTTQWYWSRWIHLLKYPRHEAIARLLCENIEYLPAVVMQLQSRQQLPLVFSQISSGGAQTLVRELARVRGFQDPVLWKEEPSVLISVSQGIYQHVISRKKLLAFWRPVLQGLDAHDGRVLLAVVLHGLIHAPLWLQQQPAALMKAIASVVCPAATASSSLRRKTLPSTILEDVAVSDKNLGTSTKAAFAKHRMLETEQKSQINKESITQETIEAEAPVQNLYEVSPAVVGAENPEIFTPNSSPVKKGDQFDSLAANVVGHSRDANEGEAVVDVHENMNALEGYEFITRAGGFFYLLNPLRGLLTPDRLADQAEASVWQWLLDIYRLFESKFPAMKDFMDAPLHRFILQQIQPGATSDELQQLAQALQKIPPCEFALQLFAELESRYQHTEFWCDFNHSPGFFAVPARVIATTSHWDIYLPLQSVRLDLRLVGWDVNPGWLPWLGRVVALHYVDQSTTASNEDNS